MESDSEMEIDSESSESQDELEQDGIYKFIGQLTRVHFAKARY